MILESGKNAWRDAPPISPRSGADPTGFAPAKQRKERPPQLGGSRWKPPILPHAEVPVLSLRRSGLEARTTVFPAPSGRSFEAVPATSGPHLRTRPETDGRAA